MRQDHEKVTIVTPLGEEYIVLTETDVKDLKREVRGFKGMDNVFGTGWLLPESEVNV
jgi:hypothetical protein